MTAGSLYGASRQIGRTRRVVSSYADSLLTYDTREHASAAALFAASAEKEKTSRYRECYDCAASRIVPGNSTYLPTYRPDSNYAYRS